MSPKLLLADDSVTIQRVIELTFADEEMDVVTVGDGQQAINWIEADPPDIVLADAAMPERDGYEVAAYIKSMPHLSQIPVLLLTGAFEPIDESRARAAQVDGVLSKPFEPQTVINRVRELLLGRRAQPREAGGYSSGDGAYRQHDDWHDDPPRRSESLTSAGVDRIEPISASAQPPRPGNAGGSMEDYFDRLDEVFGASPTPAPKEDGDFAFDPAAAAAPAPQARNERLRDLPAVTEIPRYEEPAWPPPRASEPARPPASAPVPAPPSAPPSVPWAPQQVRAQQPYAAAVTHHAAPPPVVRFDHVSAPARFNTPPAPAPPPAAAPVYTPPAFAPTPAAVAAPPSAQTHSEPAPLADAFEALLALEQAMVSNPLRVSGPSPAPPSADESVVAQVTQRVIAQITDRIVREVVSQQAGSIDRLVRQELDRVRNGS